MSFRPDSPIELPNGRLVCGTHRLVVCPMCTVDYSFMDEILDDDMDAENEDTISEDEDTISEDEDTISEDEDTISEDETESDEATTTTAAAATDSDILTTFRAGTGLIIPTKFHPPRSSDTPESLFPLEVGHIPIVRRFVHRTNLSQLLIYTDGACLDNGGANPRAGCSFVFKPSAPEVKGFKCFPLENKGPTGEVHQKTSNRAELRAVIAALQFRFWPGEGFSNLVIATDSEYVVEGATSWVRGWLRRGWRTSTGAAVKNRDLWECLLGEIERWDEEGLEIEYWRIPRGWNKEADYHAKGAAADKEPHDQFTRISGVMV